MLNNSGFKIACDSGISIFRKLNILPDLFLGDMDSCSRDDYKWAEANKVKIYKLKPEKDELDTEIALKYCAENNINDVYLTGMTGDRIDHVIGGIYLISEYTEINPKIAEEYLEIGIVNNENKSFLCSPDETWSVIQLDKNVKVTLKGFKYPLTDYVFKNKIPLGISNVTLGEKAEIISDNGKVFYVRWLKKV